MNPSPFLRLVLWPWSVVYGTVVRTRSWLYGRGVFQPKRLSMPVISVGNLTVGGTGKTPVVIWLAERFLAKGKRVGILSRGYRGADGSSDEIELMKVRLNSRALFGVGKNRYQNGRLLEEQGVDVFLLDDGYQHLSLERDVNILLLDASRPLGGEQLLPAGRLREPVSAMQRADVLVVTRASSVPGTAEAIARLQNYPVFAAETKLLGFRRAGGNDVMRNLPAAAGPFFVFCGIGNPGAFQLDLEKWGVEIAGKRAFADHHRYTQAEADDLAAAARESGAQSLLTTEKDAQNFGTVTNWPLPVLVAVIEVAFWEELAFLNVIEQRLAERRVAA